MIKLCNEALMFTEDHHEIYQGKVANFSIPCSDFGITAQVGLVFDTGLQFILILKLKHVRLSEALWLLNCTM